MTMPKSKGLQLSSRDLELIHTTARFKFVSSHQLRRRFFNENHPHAAMNRLNQLLHDQLLTSVFVMSKATAEPLDKVVSCARGVTSNVGRLAARLR